MNTISRTTAYCILALPMILVQHASQNVVGGGDVLIAFFVALYVLDIFISVAIHEFGHAIMARMWGWQVISIAVFPFSYHFKSGRIRLWHGSSGDIGGLVSIGTTPGRSDYRVIIFALAGPAVNLLLAAVIILILYGLDLVYVRDILGSLAITSLLLGIGNLVPWRAKGGIQSDGARVVSVLRNIVRSKLA